ncbi:tetratricopeptide repeat protein [Brevibacillus parabrevis]|uniref:tetratricopeptide repeat protein n=1 Tax=Brevibacillus parabrevis TaxID=54914 RepID=UPI002E2279AB|nr:tetratricopeptide repeat protein [Brevibacillus parabrevis]
MTITGQRIKELRTSMGLTQQELSEGIVTRSYLSQIEKGAVQPTYETLKKIASRLKCEVEDLFTESENKSLLVSEIIRLIKNCESLVETGSFSQAKKIVSGIHLDEKITISDYDLGVYFWVKGKILENENNWTEASSIFCRSVERLKESSFSNEYARSLDSLGYVYLQLDKNEEALEILNTTYDLITHNQISGITRLSCFVNIGIAHGKLGEYHSAIRFLTDALRINRATHAFFKEGQIHSSLGICYRRLSQYGKAEKCYLKALSFFQNVEDLENLASTYVNIGVLYYHIQNFQNSIEMLQEGLSLYRKLQLDFYIAKVLIELSKSHFANKEVEQAKTYLLEVVENPSNDPSLLFQANMLLGKIEYSCENYSSSLEFIWKANGLFEKHKLKNAQKEIFINIAEVYYAQKNFEKASQFYHKAHKSTFLS